MWICLVCWIQLSGSCLAHFVYAMEVREIVDLKTWFAGHFAGTASNVVNPRINHPQNH